MARPLRIEFDGAWYHVMNRGAGRRSTFTSGSQRASFLDLLGEITEIFGVEIHAYCLMVNHYHLLVHTPRAGLGRAMRHLNGVYTQRFNRHQRSDGPLFRGRYRALVVDADSYLLQVSRYIHLNPVSAGLAADPATYPDSSYRVYVGAAPAPGWLHLRHTLGYFDGEAPGVSYRRFVEAGVDGETARFYRGPRPGPVVGPESFRQEIRRRVEEAGALPNRELPEARRICPRPPMAAIARAIAEVFRIKERCLRDPQRSVRDESARARGAAALLARLEGGHSLATIAHWLGYRGYKGCSSAMNRIKHAAEGDTELAGRLDRARRIVRGGREPGQ